MSTTFISKPFEAIRFTKDSTQDVCMFLGQTPFKFNDQGDAVFVSQSFWVPLGNWITRDTTGEYDSMDPATFQTHFTPQDPNLFFNPDGDITTKPQD